MKGRPKTIEIQILAALSAEPGLRMAGLYAKVVGSSADSTKSVVHRMLKRGDLRCSAKQRNRMYFIATEKPEPKPAKPLVHAKPKPAPIIFAKPKAPERPKQRGPAHLPGPLVFTENSRRVVYPSKPDPLHTNTFSN